MSLREKKKEIMALSEAEKRDIAHKFELPERKSKIASMFRQNEQLYCICRSTDSTRFMIACDACDEWYHADCINLTKTEASAIKCYYCPLCVSSNPDLKTIYKRPGGSGVKVDRSKAGTTGNQRKRGFSQTATATRPPPKKALVEKKQQLKCPNDEWNPKTKNCGKCSGCAKHAKCIGKKTSALSDDEDFNSSDMSDSKDSEQEVEPVYIPAKPKAKAPPPKAKEVKKKVVRKPAAAKGGAAKRQPRPNARRKKFVKPLKPLQDSSSDEEAVEVVDKGPIQCHGPGCAELARPNSKYCQDYCGIALAHARIYAILPVRLTEWSLTPIVAQQHNEEELNEVRNKYNEAIEEILVLLRKIRGKELDNHLARVREKELDSDSSDEEHDDEGMIYCVSCGHEIAMKTCLKHMEKCYNKYEGKTTFGSVFKQGSIEGPPIFCDFYNGSNKTYCKRLAVLCAEHVKIPKTGDKEYCGYPVNELTNKKDPFGEFCRVRKKKCNTHFAWEKLRRASIDMQRVRMYSRMDELLDKDVKLRGAQKDRGALMGLLLNSTFNHDVVAEKAKNRKKPIEINLSEDEEEKGVDSEDVDIGDAAGESTASASTSSSGSSTSSASETDED